MTNHVSTELAVELCSLHFAFKSANLDYRGHLFDLEKHVSRYEEPWRKYHSVPHIIDGFTKIGAMSTHIEDEVALKYAWFMHDIIWVPGCSENERCSAEFAVHELKKICLYTSKCEIVQQMIMATKNHRIPEHFSGSKHDLALMIDVDLSILGAPYPAFIAQGEMIRAEYSYVSDEAFEKGRSDFALSFLQRNQIFLSKAFAHLEKQANDNLRTLLR